MLMRKEGEVRGFDRTKALKRKEFGKAGWLGWPWSREQALCLSISGEGSLRGGGSGEGRGGGEGGPSDGFNVL